MRDNTWRIYILQTLPDGRKIQINANVVDVMELDPSSGRPKSPESEPPVNARIDDDVIVIDPEQEQPDPNRQAQGSDDRSGWIET